MADRGATGGWPAGRARKTDILVWFQTLPLCLVSLHKISGRQTQLLVEPNVSVNHDDKQDIQSVRSAKFWSIDALRLSALNLHFLLSDCRIFKYISAWIGGLASLSAALNTFNFTEWKINPLKKTTPVKVSSFFFFFQKTRKQSEHLVLIKFPLPLSITFFFPFTLSTMGWFFLSLVSVSGKSSLKLKKMGVEC